MAAAAIKNHLIPNALRSDEHKEQHEKRHDQSDHQQQNHNGPPHSLAHHKAPADEQRYSQQPRNADPQQQYHNKQSRQRGSEADREEEKSRIASMADEWYSKGPMEVEQVAQDPQDKVVGHSSSTLRCEDFELLKTLGTGTTAFAECCFLESSTRRSTFWITG